jgi:hypothetical protein
MQVAYELAPVIAEIISAHCPGTRARDEFVHACVYGQWDDAKEMIEGTPSPGICEASRRPACASSSNF